MSSGCVRASDAITGPCTSAAILDTDSKSPGDEAANPASITSTLSLASWDAMATLSSGESADAGCLLAIAQRCIEDDQTIGHGKCSLR